MGERENRMKVKINSIRDDVELHSTLEVTKLLAFYGLLSGLRSLGGDQRARLEQVEKALQSFFAMCDIDLPEKDATKFRQHAKSTLDDLFARVRIDDAPFKTN
jgi:hypothetical protein